MKHGEYIYLIFDHPTDHPYYIKGHVSMEDAQKTIDKEEDDVVIKSISHKYGRMLKIGPDHEDCLDGNDTTFRVIDNPRPSYYPVTECHA
jgi:hypothetical protein